MHGGMEWLIDAAGCAAEALRDRPLLQRLGDTIVHDLDLRVVGRPLWHQFPPPGGVTGLYLLTESHLALHTYPEAGLATLNLYCCRSRPAWDWERRLKDLLGATRVVVRCTPRGQPVAEGASA